MQFTVLPVGTRPASPRPGQPFLVRDDWDDHHFKTTFRLVYAEAGGYLVEIGLVKIGRFGMAAPARTSPPEDFEALDGAFFSLGQSDAYYVRLRELGAGVQHAVLRALNDVAFDLDLLSRARTESVMGTSLLRSVDADSVVARFRGSEISAGSSAEITDVTRRHLFDALCSAHSPRRPDQAVRLVRQGGFGMAQELTLHVPGRVHAR
ncbi:hypothetical protein [Streptomyces sp. NPDC017964]|uniref:hypothetical protein n=1 Tax=Streptomyces sp. NPDC017964 TaxID=3365022 RepID=UPI003787C193